MYTTHHRLMQENKKQGKKSFAVLVDPDKLNEKETACMAKRASEADVDYIFVGGSLLITDCFEKCVRLLKKNCDIPVIIFPGSPAQISRHADALLYLSMISSRNPDLLIGQHVLSAPLVKQSCLEVMPTGYMVIDGGAPTSVSYISNSCPIPANKEDIAACTAMAGEMLGMKLIFLDAGSGAPAPVSLQMIKKVSGMISVPLIVGGGIKDPETAYRNCKAGADIIVVGNAVERNNGLISDLAAAVHSSSLQEK